MVINCVSNGKLMIIHFIVGLIKRYYYIKMSYFLPYGHSKNKRELNLDLSDYATKSDLKTRQVLIHHNLLEEMI